MNTVKASNISGFADKDPDNPWAMQMIVHDTKDFSDLELAYVTAKAVLSYLESSMGSPERLKAIDEWLQGRFRKVLRRAKNASWSNIQEVDGETFDYHGVSVRVLTPTQKNDIPKIVQKAQVSGLEVLPHHSSFIQDSSHALTIFLNRSLHMSPGKAAAASAHVAQKMFIDLMNYAYINNDAKAQKDVESWISAGFPIKVSTLGSIGEHIAKQATVAIHDAGLTEVESGSITAIGVRNEIFFD